MEFLAPAKINLRLEILGRREDGYHEIRSLICPVGIYDTISLTRVREGIILQCGDKDTPEGKDNLVFKAASFLLKEAQVSRGVKIRLKKQIPVASGLGGGSSDAATTLKGINELFSLHYSQEKLKILGAKIGSDVPFFLEDGPAWASGRGEKLFPVKLSPQFWVLLVNPGIKISTAWAYSQFKLPGKNKLIKFTNAIDLLQFGEEILYNEFEKIIIPYFSEVAEIKKILKTLGAWGALMSGSGATVFGIFFSQNEAQKAERKLKENYRERNWKVFLAPALL